MLSRMRAFRDILMFTAMVLAGPGIVRTQEDSNNTLRIGAIITRYAENRRNDGWGFENTGSAINIAVDKFEMAGGLIGGMRIEIHRVDDQCTEKRAVYEIMKMKKTYNPDVVMGPSCSGNIAILGYFMSYWNLPFWPYGGTSPALEDKETQNVLVRIHATGSKIGVAFTHLCDLYNWHRVVMITSVTYCDMGATGVYNEFMKQGIVVADWVKTLSVKIDDASLDSYLQRLKTRGRIFIVCFDDWSSHQRFFTRAEALGMATPEYVYLFYSIRGPINERIFTPWLYDRTLTAAEAAEAKVPFYYYKQVTLTTLSGPSIETFYEEVPRRLADAPFFYNESLLNGWQGSWQAVNLHDLTLTYLTLVNEMLATGQDYRNGTLLFEKMRNRRIEGQQLQSPLLYDENADRVPNFWFWSLSPFQKRFEVAIEMVMTDPPDERMHKKGPVYWGTPDNLPPPDIPVCGYRGEKCVEEETDQELLYVGIGIGVVVLAGISILWTVLARQRSKESALKEMIWKIKYEDLEITKKKIGSSKGTISTTVDSSSGSVSTGLSSSGDADESAHTGQFFTTIGNYKGQVVAVRSISRQNVILQRRDLVELKVMKEMNHDNINSFIGACTDPPNICYVMVYCSQGSLQDILHNDDMKLDWTFKLSLIYDLGNGMSYLQKSELHSHGNLKSGNCLVDNRWTLKISDYGLKTFKDGEEKDEQTEYEKYRDMLWTAPELLRMPHKPYYGTQKADVYSFAIILQEIVYCALPYFLTTDTPKEVVQRVARGVDPPFRPRLQELTDDTNSEILDLMIMCWYEDPNDRPDFEICKKKILALNGGKKIDVMGSILDKLEKYAGNLEAVVGQRTSELVEEKKKTDLILYSMMPHSVADMLKNGRKVDPTYYNECTVFFSDICGFTALSSESTPMQVVDFLNDLYTLFDNILSQHDVYKVETIGDAYMVVSGIPKVNGSRHVAEIANMALDLLSGLYTDFRVRHRPGKVMKLRTGMHTGPCAAGVVGLTMPRYCLFGGTVSLASAMESCGEPMKIQMSEASYQASKKHSGYKTALRGPIDIKGKEKVTTYWLLGKEGYMKPLPT